MSKLALLIDRDWRDPHPAAITRDFFGLVTAVWNEKQAILGRQARLLAWVHPKDVLEVGYSGWEAFVKEESPWDLSQTSVRVGVVEKGLDVIEDALSNNEIDFKVAMRALTELGDAASREAQVQWLQEAQIGRLPESHRCMEVVSGDEMRRVLKARGIGELVLGSGRPPPVIDNFLIECHARSLTNEQIRERANAAPPMPDRLGKAVPMWRNDPASGLLGPWIEPTDIQDAVAKIRATGALLAYRRLLLGMAYHVIRSNSLWREVPGCNGLEELCRVHLRISQRTFQRHAQAGRAFFNHPEVRKEIEAGRLTIDRALFAFDQAGGSELALESWIELVQRLSRTELHHSQKRAGDARKAYAPALTMAKAVEAIVRGETEATGNGGVAARIAEHLQAVGATGQIQVALRDASDRRPPRPPPTYIVVPPKLLAAADYVLAVIKLPTEYGPRRMIKLDRYTCQNSRCRRRALRVHPHHLHERQHGGTDDPANIVTHCPACHQRGIHSGRMSVVRIGDWLIWTWPGDKRAVLMDSRVSELVYDRAGSVVRSAVDTQPQHPANA